MEFNKVPEETRKKDKEQAKKDLAQKIEERKKPDISEDKKMDLDKEIEELE